MILSPPSAIITAILDFESTAASPSSQQSFELFLTLEVPSIEQSIVLALILPFGVLGNSISIELTVYLVYFVLFYLFVILQLTILTEREITFFEYFFSS